MPDVLPQTRTRSSSFVARASLLLGLTVTLGAYACDSETSDSPGEIPDSSTRGDKDGSISPDANDAAAAISDAQRELDATIDSDGACTAVASRAQPTVSPVDIVWVVDNSNSMATAIPHLQQGLEGFATTIDASGLDYRVIMLSLRSATSPVTVGGSLRYPICVPPPLAGDSACGDGPRFFQSSIDIRSTQLLEQFLGTLGQTAGYTAADSLGGPAWAGHLRAGASKMIVVATDDNARLSATDFENFVGGKNPFNNNTLPPGVLRPSWSGMFENYRFSGIYGWGDATDPKVSCQYSDESKPPSSGPTYTSLVEKTGGLRAKLCDGASAWQSFSAALAQAVLETAKVSCEIAIPEPPVGAVDPTMVNVAFGSSGNSTSVPNVASAAHCASDPGWYYDDPQQPTKVTLCPASCDAAQISVGPGKAGYIDVLFGCRTEVK